MPRNPPEPRTDGPNRFPNAQTAKDASMAGVSCRYLGRTYYEGDKICWDGAKWICGRDGWGETDEPC